MQEITSLASWLRAQPSLTGTAPALDLESLPDDPFVLFVNWLSLALSAAVPEPLAATLATVDSDGVPDARTLIIKDVSRDAWSFAGSRFSQKGAQLSERPAAALNLWWQPQVRAIRVRGHVAEATAEESAADLAARPAAAREGIAEGEWVLWRLVPERVEFWQGSTDRRHKRIIYTRGATGWVRSGSGAGGA